MKKFGLLIMMLMMSVALFAKGDIKTVVYTTTPQMHCAGCENKIKGNLKFVKGIKKIETNVEKQTVTITYDADKTTTDKIEVVFKEIGYSVKIVSVSAAKTQPAMKVAKDKKQKTDENKVDAETGASLQAK